MSEPQVETASTQPTAANPEFPNAPNGWHPSDAIVEASKDRLPLDDDHWETIRTIQAVFADRHRVKVEHLRAALERRFEQRGGLRYLYSLFPKGPVAQGCRLAGLPSPSDSPTVTGRKLQ